ncbi:MAG: phosphopantetheine-binding protein [Pyrinomonadaceae bacterium]
MRNDDSDKLNDEPNAQGDGRTREAAAQAGVCAATPPPAQSVREYEAPRNEVEAGVVEILAEFLNMERVGIHDNFILLGGESLLAAQAAWRIRDRFGCEVTLRSILAGTVADIAAEILAADSEQQA